MTPLRVGLDLDGCLYCDHWLHGMRARCAEKRGVAVETLPMPSSWLFADSWGFTRDEFQEVMDESNDTGIYREGEPDWDGVDMMREFYALGIEMHIVSHRPAVPAVLRDTYLWVATYNLPASSVTLTSKKDGVETDLFLDDGLHVVEALEEVGETIPVLFTTNQNRDADWQGLRANGFPHFSKMVLAARDALMAEEGFDEFERQGIIADALYPEFLG